MPAQPVSDGELMQQLQQGDSAALDSLVRRHHGFVVRHARRTLDDSNAAEDVAQEVFLRVYRFCAQFRRNDNFMGWLATLTTRLALNELRTRRRKHWRVTSSLGAQGSANNPPGDSADWRPGSHSEDPAEGQLLREERNAAVRAAIEMLPDLQRQALWLQRFEGLDLESVGRALNRSPSAVKSLLHRARLTLAEELSDWKPDHSLAPIAPPRQGSTVTKSSTHSSNVQEGGTQS